MIPAGREGEKIKPGALIYPRVSRPRRAPLHLPKAAADKPGPPPAPPPGEEGCGHRPGTARGWAGPGAARRWLRRPLRRTRASWQPFTGRPRSPAKLREGFAQPRWPPRTYKKKKKKCGIEARSPMSRSNAKRQRQGSLLSRRAGAEVTDGAIRLFHAGRAAWVKPWGPPREGQGHGPLPHAAAPVPAASRPFRGRDPAPV